MTPNTTRNWLAALLALSFTACTADVLEPGAEVGVLEMPLVSTATNGTQFMLEATFDLVGPETLQAVADPTQPDWSDDVLTLTPRVGSYSLTISSWRVFELLVDPNTGNINGSSWISAATLLSGAVQSVEIFNNQTTSVVYQFSVPGAGVINFARGTLNIDFAVQPGLPEGAACNTAIECASLVCEVVAGGGICVAPSCTDGVQNGTETSPDCGGACGTCGGAGTACTPAQAAACAPGDTCTLDATGNPTCTPGLTLCPAAAGQCAPGELCVLDAAGLPSCLDVDGSAGAACFPEQPTCDVGLSCVAVGGEFRCEQATVSSDPNLACIRINEVGTSGPSGGFDEFVELYNACAVDVNLGGSRLMYVSSGGGGGNVQHDFTAGGPTVLAGTYFVVAHANFSGGSFAASLAGGLSNTAGGVGLEDSAGSYVDSVTWGNVVATHPMTETLPAPAVVVINSEAALSRTPNGSDTNNNANDFQERARTPGAANL